MNQVSCHKSLIRNVSSLTKHRSSASGHLIQGHSLFSSFPSPHHLEVGLPAHLLPQKPDPQFFFFGKTLVICERRSNPAEKCDKDLVFEMSDV